MVLMKENISTQIPEVLSSLATPQKAFQKLRYFEGQMWGDGLLDEDTFRKHKCKRLR